jgi:hypothetical protein
MNLLRKYVRSLLKEQDMGKYAWPDKRHPRVSWPDHWPEPKVAKEEENTLDEDELYDVLREFLTSYGDIDTRLAQTILGYIQKGQYPEAFQVYDGYPKVYRGMKVTDAWLRKYSPNTIAAYKRWGGEWDDDIQPSGSYVGGELEVPYTFGRKSSRGRGEGSSWTTDDQIAIKFAEGFEGSSALESEMPGRRHPIVLVASTADNMFLDVEPFYLYTGLNEYQHEDELIALGDVKVNEILTFMGDDEEEDEY